MPQQPLQMHKQQLLRITIVRNNYNGLHLALAIETSVVWPTTERFAKQQISATWMKISSIKIPTTATEIWTSTCISSKSTSNNNKNENKIEETENQNNSVYFFVY